MAAETDTKVSDERIHRPIDMNNKYFFGWSPTNRHDARRHDAHVQNGMVPELIKNQKNQKIRTQPESPSPISPQLPYPHPISGYVLHDLQETRVVYAVVVK